MTGDQGFGGPGAGSEPRDGGPRYGPPSYGANPYTPSGSYGGGYQPGPGQSPYGPPGMLASAADRDRALDLLKAAYGEGRLDKEEFDLRSDRVMAARHYGELAPIVADLPGGGAFAPPPAPYPQPGYYMAVQAPMNNLAVGSLVCSLCGFIPPATIAAVVMGHVARHQIRQRGQRGDGVAIAGLVIGYLGVALWVLFLVAGIVAASHG